MRWQPSHENSIGPIKSIDRSIGPIRSDPEVRFQLTSDSQIDSVLNLIPGCPSTRERFCPLEEREEEDFLLLLLL